MLFLLRQIRRKLLSNKKVTTYLLYAIGEIILVVVGILIAVSIDDWNEQSKRRLLSNQALKELREEIVESKTEMNTAILKMNQLIDLRTEYLNYPKEDAADSIKMLEISKFFTFYTDPIRLPVVESEIGANNKIIQSSVLVEKLQQITEAALYYNKGLEYIEKDIQTNLIPRMVEQEAMLDLLKTFKLIEATKHSNADIYNNEGFKNAIASGTLMIRSLASGGENFIESCDELISVIDQEISK